MIAVAFAPGQQIKARGVDLRGAYVVVRPFFTGTPPHLVYECQHARNGHFRIIRAEQIIRPRLRAAS